MKDKLERDRFKTDKEYFEYIDYLNETYREPGLGWAIIFILIGLVCLGIVIGGLWLLIDFFLRLF